MTTELVGSAAIIASSPRLFEAASNASKQIEKVLALLDDPTVNVSNVRAALGMLHIDLQCEISTVVENYNQVRKIMEYSEMSVGTANLKMVNNHPTYTFYDAFGSTIDQSSIGAEDDYLSAIAELMRDEITNGGINLQWQNDQECGFMISIT